MNIYIYMCVHPKINFQDWTDQILGRSNYILVSYIYEVESKL